MRLYNYFIQFFKIIKGNRDSRFKLLEKINYFLLPTNFLGEYDKICFDDKSLLEIYLKYDKKNFRSFERKYVLKELIKLTRNVNGDTAELGVYFGATSEIILNEILDKNKKHHMFDSWEGLSSPGQKDGSFWKKNSLNSSFKVCEKNLEKFSNNKKQFYRGWIPKTFNDINKNLKFSFVHFDLDLYEPTIEGLKYFYPKINKGGVLIFDDYPFKTCPGVKDAVDEFFSDKSEEIIRLTMNAFVIKD